MLLKPPSWLAGVEGPEAAQVAGVLHSWLDGMRSEHMPVSQRVVDLIADVDAVAEQWASRRGNAEVADAEVPSESVLVREISTDDAAARLGVSRRRVGQLVGNGSLRGRRVGRSLLVDVVSVESLRAQREVA